MERVISLVRVKNEDNYMILIKKDSFGKNVPSEDTFISKNHAIYTKDGLIMAKKLVNNNNITIEHRGHDIIYNILFKKHISMVINNMKVETLNPYNNLARKYLKNL